MSPSFMCNNFAKRESDYSVRDQNAITLPNFLKNITYGRNLLDTVKKIVYPHI